ncbi:lytic transglycosylase domain-containing protein [Lysobacter sp. TY2-98]|uniref:lytic transglycosylase domain-containing protein n=1 Tax=Lysobacter sp. TY2-98 TaxID=2290922 RepID=UPI001F0755DD|nr:lytic transglycosylase domain-containing protein [Lysobacter sp. TY2-98]
MRRLRPLPLSSLLVLAFAAALPACAQMPPPDAKAAGPATPIAPTAAVASAARPDPQLARVREALAAAEAGTFDAAAYADLARHPLYGWIEYAALRRDLASLDRARADSFLQRYGGQAVGEAFRAQWIAEATRRQDWAAVDAAWKPTLKDVGLRCSGLQAKAALGRTDAQWTQQAQTIWREASESLPSQCDPVFAALDARGGLTPALRWERLEKAAEAWQPAVMRTAARGLPADEAALGNDYASFVEALNDRALSWPKTDRSRRIASYGLARYAKSVPRDAQAQLDKFGPALGFTDVERGRVLYQAALWTASSYEPESAQRLAAVPASAYDDRLREWRAREAMARSDWAGALAAIRTMPSPQRDDSRWQYFEARLSELQGDRDGAQRLYRAAASKPEFHGFLAADRLGQAYTLCPWIPGDSPSVRASVAADPALQRSLALWDIDRAGWATAEWNDALTRFDATRRITAIELAQQHGWFDRAVFSLGKENPEELRLYTLRFPIHHEATIRREAQKNGLDAAWVAAEIRAESVFNPKARSGANAIGLMQLIPSTGAATAARIGVPWTGESSLYDPDTSIILGTAYLRQLLDGYGEGRPYYTLAGYNAGPAPLARWKSQRPGMDPDFWIETITYKETRDYVARVLAFSVLYDWRMTGGALRVSDRLRGNFGGQRTSFSCPLATTPATPQPMPPKSRRS